jgi:hypothetical protein
MEPAHGRNVSTQQTPHNFFFGNSFRVCSDFALSRPDSADTVHSNALSQRSLLDWQTVCDFCYHHAYWWPFDFCSSGDCWCGQSMDVALGVYSVSMRICAEETYQQAAICQNYKLRHTLWSWRLYGLEIGSWLYRILYGFILGVHGSSQWSTLDLNGPVDKLMNCWAFFAPTLVVVDC